MRIEFSSKAEEELDEMDSSLRKYFLTHAEKIAEMPPKQHLRFGLPFNVEEVTRQARMIYEFREDTCFILHCFKNHKEYEQWHKSYQ